MTTTIQDPAERIATALERLIALTERGDKRSEEAAELQKAMHETVQGKMDEHHREVVEGRIATFIGRAARDFALASAGESYAEGIYKMLSNLSETIRDGRYRALVETMEEQAEGGDPQPTDEPPATEP
jgi:hypothetical protein